MIIGPAPLHGHDNQKYNDSSDNLNQYTEERRGAESISIKFCVLVVRARVKLSHGNDGGIVVMASEKSLHALDMFISNQKREYVTILGLVFVNEERNVVPIGGFFDSREGVIHLLSEKKM